MRAREQIQKRIDQKKLALGELRAKLRDAETYIQALQETILLLPKEPDGTPPENVLRKGSLVSKARMAIKAQGKPLYISTLLKALGFPNEKNRRVSLSGSIAHYARRGIIFTKTEPNTFGLIEMKSVVPEPPITFGGMDDPDK